MGACPECGGSYEEKSFVQFFDYDEQVCVCDDCKCEFKFVTKVEVILHGTEYNVERD